MDTVRNRIKAILTAVEQMIYSDKQPVDSVRIAKADYHFSEEFHREGKEFREFGRNETWGELDQHYYFLADVTIPEQMADRTVRAVLNTGATDIWNTDNPQIMAYVNGKFAATLDMNHQFVILSEHAQPGEGFELAFYAYSSAYAGTFTGTNFFRLEIAVYREEAARLYYDMQAIYEAADLLPEDDLSRIEGLKALEKCINLLDLRRPGSPECYESMKQAAGQLENTYYASRRPNPVTVHSIGHTHIDVAWKWPLRQTRQKAVRSFETVLNLMDRYPEYRFMSSQPQLYEFVKEDAPGVFARIRERIKEGRWEAEGAMWLEPDCNISSGESLIRHILYGRRFFEEELGADKNEVLWLPDVFGYSAAMPQILQKSGIPYFMTTKIGWNEFNRFPHDTFLWKGIDGSEVLTHLISTRNYQKPGDLKMVGNHSTTYNGLQNASQLMGTWQRYQDKDVSTEVLTCYGYGDGGGGPTEEMLEQSRRLEHSVVECPAARQTGVKEFFHILEEKMDRKRLAVWDGELYLEFHRGTYTSMAQNKKYNRKAEFKNTETEQYAVMAALLEKNYKYPVRELERAWKLLLLNQFHDILPGSSIKEVYEDSAEQYREIFAIDEQIQEEAKQIVREKLIGRNTTSEERRCVVWNPLSFARTGLIREEDGNWKQVTAGPGGMTICTPKTTSQTDCLTEVVTDDHGHPVSFCTPYFAVKFDSNAEISGLLDLREERELIQKGQTGNRLTVYEDRPAEFDAWNIDEGYLEKSWEVSDVEEFRILENGPETAALYVRRNFQDSVIEQTIRFYRHTARIDFATQIDWHEHQQLLRVAFPMDILAHEADYEIQFGNVKRPTHKNTSWDRARFEVCAHKWADLSEPGYGTALLNDCKYGYDIHDGVMGLTLIKSGVFPNPDADQGMHEFTYALFPHKGDFRKGGVIREAYDLNCPLEWEKISGAEEAAYSLLQVAEENVLADTVKMAEDGDGVIIRLYESFGMRTKAHLTFPLFGQVQAVTCDCMEKASEAEQKSLYCRGDVWTLEMKPYEIKTLRISVKK